MDFPALFQMFGPYLAPAVAVALAIRSERKARERERVHQVLKLKELLQAEVVDKIESALKAINRHERRISATEKAQAHLAGFLRGKGCFPTDLCPDLPDREEGDEG